MNALIRKFLPPDPYALQLRIFLIPFLLGGLVLTIIPAFATFVFAFTKYNAVDAPDWVGLENFVRLLQSDYVRVSLKNSALFLAMAVPLRLCGALLLALLLQRNGRLYGYYRAAVYLPTVIPEVAYALIWLWILNPVYGPLNLMLSGLGFSAPAWLAEPDLARLSIVLMLGFQMGEGFIVLLAGLQSIPRALYEAARVDGADAVQVFFKITLPLLMPWMMVLFFRDLVVSLQSTFTPSYVMTYGGPFYGTTFAPLLLYEVAFDFFDFGLAAALLVLIFAVMVLLALIALTIFNKRTVGSG